MPKLSAGVLLYRARAGVVDVLLAHPGGPFWAGKDDGAWSIPKGEYTGGEDPWLAARREFSEEIGLCVPDGPRIDFGSLKQSGGKVVTVFGVRADLDITDARSSTFELDWPKGSGKMRKFPEVDRVSWFPVARARTKLLKGQRGFLDWRTRPWRVCLKDQNPCLAERPHRGGLPSVGAPPSPQNHHNGPARRAHRDRRHDHQQQRGSATSS